jgi:formate hydrogenlyase subunit 4
MRDITKLFVKETVLAENASWIFRSTPYVVFGATLMAGAIIPVVSADLPLGATADIIALVSIFALARFFTALAGLDTGTAFGGMGTSREMMVSSLAEPAVLMSVFTVSLVSHSTSLSHMVHELTTVTFILRPSLAFALLAFVLIAIAETGRIPVDNPSTHLELTMIHEAMLLEYSGRHLALIEWASMMKLFLFASLGIALFLPWGIAGIDDPAMIPVALVALTAKLALTGVFIVLVETGLSKMRIFRVAEFLGMAFLLASLGMLSYFILE